MKISDCLEVIKSEMVFERTPSSFPLTQYSKDTLKATIEDQKNYGSDVFQCKNCDFIASSLLFEDGCKNCGSKDLNKDVKL